MRAPSLLPVLRALACAGPCLVGCGGDSAPEPRPRPPAAEGAPNIVMIVVDTLRADRLSFYGCEKETAPFLAEIASESVVFDHTWAASSWTAPSTASIFTGVYPDRHGVLVGYFHYKNRQERLAMEAQLNRIPPELATLPRALASAGYRCYGIADNPNVCERMGFTAGFELFETYDYEGAERVNETLEAWLPTIQGEEAPYFVYLHYMDPHAPYHAREPWYEEELEREDDPIHNDRLAYDSEIAYLDQHLEQVFEWLDLREEAVVLFTSDHGEEFAEHGGKGHTEKLFNELVSIPLFIRPPGPGRAARVSAQASQVDLLPTVLELAQARPARLSDGISLLPFLEDAQASVPERPIYMMRSGLIDAQPLERRAVVQGNFKGILTRVGPLTRPREVRTEFDLYHLGRDPGELEDVMDAHPRVAGDLRGLLFDHVDRPRPVRRSFFEPEAMTDERAEMLDRLGYSGDDEDEDD